MKILKTSKFPIIDFENWEELNQIRENSREINSEGLMLKQKNSPYHSGRKKAIGGNGKSIR
jgi:ATP-dependent DNA ligase